MFGLTRREWYLIGAGMSVQGAFIGAVFHSLLVIGINVLCLAFDIYMLRDCGTEE